MIGRRTFGRLGIGAVVLVMALASPLGATGEPPSQWNKLYREDALADFVVESKECDLARTELQVGALQTFFTDFLTGGKTVREVLFGVAIEEHDCLGEFVGAEGNAVRSSGFDVSPNLESSRIDITLRACTLAGSCFPVHIDLYFKGAGPIAHADDRDLIKEPGCTINNRFITNTRAALVKGTVRYTMPRQPTRTFQLSSDDLSPVGANLSNHSERHFLQGSTGSCVEITG